MTTPISGMGTPGGAMPVGLDGWEGVAPTTGAGVDPSEPPLVLEAGAVGGTMVSDPSDVALLVGLLQTECSKLSATSEKREAKAAAEMKRDQIEKKLENIAKALAKQAESEKWGDVVEGLKWAAVAIGAIVAAATSVVTFGTTGAIAALVITLALTANTVAKEVTNKLLADGKIDKDTAEIIGAVFGNLQDIVAACIDEKHTNADAKWAIMVLGVVDAAAKAVLSIVFSGGSDVGKIFDAVGKLAAIGAEALTEAQTIIAETIEDGEKKGLSEEELLALQLCFMVIQLAGSIGAGASGGSENRNLDRETRQALQIMRGAGGALKAGASAGSAGAAYAQASANADSFEAKAKAERAEALKEAALQMLQASIDQLQEIIDELDETQQDVETMLNLGWERASLSFGGARV